MSPLLMNYLQLFKYSYFERYYIIMYNLLLIGIVFYMSYVHEFINYYTFKMYHYN